MKGSALAFAVIVICLFAVLGMTGYIFYSSSHHQVTSTTPSSVTPDIPVKDFAPNLPISEKTTILIQLSDSSMMKYIVPTNQVQMYTKNLPEGDHIVSQSP